VPIGDDENLGRTGDHVDPDPAEDAPLRSGNVRITWPDDFVDRRNRRRAEREGGDRLRPADAVYLVDPDQLGGSENQRVDDTPGAGTVITNRSTPATLPGIAFINTEDG
jgi:hypothetical protein